MDIPAWSTPYAFLGRDRSAAAGTLVRVETAKGEEMLTFKPAMSWQSLVVCSPKLAKGATYNVLSGGSPYTSFTISGILTTAGMQAGGLLPGGKPGRR